MKQHAAFLYIFCNHPESIQTTVTLLAVSTAEGDKWAIKAIMPGAVLVDVPQTVLIGTCCV